MKIDKDTHVYCTHCRYFQLDRDMTPFCEYQNYCDLRDPEDSAPLKFRPWYGAKAVSE